MPTWSVYGSWRWSSRSSPRTPRCRSDCSIRSVSGSPLQLAIRRLAAGEHLTEEETAAAFDVVMRGEGSPTLVSALLMALRVKGETSVEVAGGARAMRRAMVQLETS